MTKKQFTVLAVLMASIVIVGALGVFFVVLSNSNNTELKKEIEEIVSKQEEEKSKEEVDIEEYRNSRLEKDIYDEGEQDDVKVMYVSEENLETIGSIEFCLNGIEEALIHTKNFLEEKQYLEDVVFDPDEIMEFSDYHLGMDYYFNVYWANEPHVMFKQIDLDFIQLEETFMKYKDVEQILVSLETHNHEFLTEMTIDIQRMLDTVNEVKEELDYLRGYTY